MPSPIWSGTLTFGLVAIPVQMLSATSSHKTAFRQVHAVDMGPVKYKKVCELDGQALDQGDIGRAYEAGPDMLVLVTDAELDQMPLPTAKAIEVSGFLDLASVPAEMFDKPYFLSPSNAAGKKPYVLMREALTRSGKAAVGKYAIRGSENLGVVYAAGEVLVLQRLRWPDEVRAADDAAPRQDVDITADEAKAADDLITALGDADMQAYHDEYAEAVARLVEARTEGVEPGPAKEPKRTADAEGPVDLMAALKAAADQARADRGEDADVHHMGDRKASPKKTAARKTAKKTAAKKTARKKAG